MFAVAARAVRVITGLQLGAAGLLFIGATIVYAAEIVIEALNTGIPTTMVVGFAICIFMFGAAHFMPGNQEPPSTCCMFVPPECKKHGC